MKTKLYGFLILLSIISVSCQKTTFDLSNVKLGDNHKNYDLENKNIFLKDEGDIKNVIFYDADDNKNIIFGTIPLDSTLSSKITVFNNKIAAIQTNSSPKSSLEFIEKVIKLNGKPVHQISDKAHVDAKVNKQIISQLKKIFPNDVAPVEDEQNSFHYPYAFLWDKENYYSILSFSIDSDGRIRNTYTSFTKEAFKKNIVYGLKFPTPSESPWYNYLK